VRAFARALARAGTLHRQRLGLARWPDQLLDVGPAVP
jgi:hypothetical protein